jgi:hypothetical protein
MRCMALLYCKLIIIARSNIKSVVVSRDISYRHTAFKSTRLVTGKSCLARMGPGWHCEELREKRWVFHSARGSLQGKEAVAGGERMAHAHRLHYLYLYAGELGVE